MGAVSHIDRSSFEPPYAQLARLLRERIASGEYRAGDRLPSEAELCGTYRVSPMTVRRAVTLLVQEEVAITEQGRGTFVKSPELGAATFDLRDLRRYLDDAGTDVRILEARIVSPSLRLCSKLAVEAGSRVIAIKRILSSDGEPVFYHSEYLVFDPMRPLVEAELGVTALQDLFSGAGGSGPKYGLRGSQIRDTFARAPSSSSIARSWSVPSPWSAHAVVASLCLLYTSPSPRDR